MTRVLFSPRGRVSVFESDLRQSLSDAFTIHPADGGCFGGCMLAVIATLPWGRDFSDGERGTMLFVFGLLFLASRVRQRCRPKQLTVSASRMVSSHRAHTSPDVAPARSHVESVRTISRASPPQSSSHCASLCPPNLVSVGSVFVDYRRITGAAERTTL